MKNSDAYIWPFYLFGAIAVYFGIAVNSVHVIAGLPDDVENNPVFFSLLGFFWFMLMFAHSAGISDGKRIKLGLGINHGKAFMKRALFACAVCFIMHVNVLYLFSAAFAFSTIFNFTLNDHRALKWFYISNSNSYDKVFLKIFKVQLPIIDNINADRLVKAGKVKVITESTLSIVLFLIVKLILQF